VIKPVPIEPRRSRLPWLLIAGVALVAAIALAFFLPPRDDAPKPSPVAVTATVDVAPPIDMPIATIDAAIDASLDAPVDAPIDAPRQRPRPTQVDQKQQPPPVVVTKYKVTINATPGWSNFTVDRDPKQYQTMTTIELAPGPHKLHFTGNEFHPADQWQNITVVDKNFTHVETLKPLPGP
jgi:hypothetical protein